jgi:biopolymer transport protein ExbD
MAIGIKRGRADINVTPMIDVLLVLLIIFMVVLPENSVGLDVRAPQPADNRGRPLPAQDIMLTALGGGKVRLDQMEVDIADLPRSLHAILANRTAGVAFVKGTGELDFAQVAEIIDIAKGNGWPRVGLLPK